MTWPPKKPLALVLRTTDWSETSRIATLWTREFGKVRALAKGGRRLKSNFENALDLLTVCSIVFLRKSSGSLDLLTEAQVVQRFPRLRTDLAALYAAYYVAELLARLDAGLRSASRCCLMKRWTRCGRSGRTTRDQQPSRERAAHRAI